jgi:hypothetical protein
MPKKRRGRPRGSYRWTPEKIGLLRERAQLRLGAEDPSSYEVPRELQKSVAAVAQRIYAEFPGEYQSAEQIRKLLEADYKQRKTPAAKFEIDVRSNVEFWKVLLED